MPKIALLDLDSTLANYDKAMSAEQAKIASPSDPLFLQCRHEPHVRARRQLIQKQAGFWRNLEPLKLGFDIVAALKEIGFSLNVLTQGPRDCPNAWTEKAEWCKEHLPGIPITITQNKALTYGRVLVDDFSPYFLRWLEWRPRGFVVCVAHPWNEQFAEGKEAFREDVFRYDGENLDALRDKLEKVFER